MNEKRWKQLGWLVLRVIALAVMILYLVIKISDWFHDGFGDFRYTQTVVENTIAVALLVAFAIYMTGWITEWVQKKKDRRN